MSEMINWLHLTDVHFGLDDHSWLWPKIKHDLFNDIEIIGKDIGGWDLVFFTGDFTQQAKNAEFEKLSTDLQSLWDIFSKSGKIPLLCAIPGNHDLVRPNPNESVTKALTQLWWSDPEIRKQFWMTQDNEYGLAIKKYFANYTEWISKLPIPKIEPKTGLLPGDFSGTFEKGKFRLGIIGLNSTFLQIVGGDFKGKLDMHVAQLNSVCGGDPHQWLKEQTASVLLTHQPPSYLAQESLEEFRQEIYPPGRFLTQLCGHQHEPEASETREAGAPPRRLRQGPSFFGLENWGDTKPVRRTHGYNAGQFVFEESVAFEKLWPRIAIKGRHGGLNICPDHTYKLQEGNCMITHFDLDINEVINLDNGYQNTSTAGTNISTYSSDVLDNDLKLLDGLPDEKTVIERLAHCPRLNLRRLGQQHLHVRLQEQSEFENELRKSRCVWVAADWGTGTEEFLASSIERFRLQEPSAAVFHFRCDDAFDIDRLEAVFQQQFGMPLQAFCALVTKQGHSFLIFDGIQPELCRGEHAERLARMAEAIVDYCPELRLIFVSRLRLESHQFSVIELRPLEIPDVRTYLKYHPEATPDLQETEIVEKLYEHSDGLPMHLDRIIRALKVSSLTDVLENSMEGSHKTDDVSEQTSKALKHAVLIIASSEDHRSKRSFRLLKVLSVLPYGETIATLHHYLPTEPFFDDNALQLKDLALIDAIALQQTIPNITAEQSRTNLQSAPKILKVPRQIRDYIQVLLPEKEREEIVIAGIDKYFGSGWRDGKIKLRSLPMEYREYLNSGAGNEFALICHLINQSKSRNDNFIVKIGALLGIAYAEHLFKADRFRDLTTVTGPLLQLIDRDDFPSEWSRLCVLYGKGLRMTAKREDALKYFRASLEIDNATFSNDEKASIWLNIALALENNNEEEAIAAAEEVRKYAEKESSMYLQAQSIISGFIPDASDKKKKLSYIEKKARKKHHLTVANNIAIDLASETEISSEKIRLLDNVLNSKEQGYNKVRALVKRVKAAQKAENGSIKASEILALTLAYSYLHTQRFGSLFNQCHDALWNIYESAGNTAQLLRLFRHSSFLWRIRGDDRKETKYLKILAQKNIERVQPSEKTEILFEFRYFTLRVNLVLPKQ